MKVTQRDRILTRLQAGGWVPAFALAEISLRYGAQIHRLRQAGYEIELQSETVKGQCHTAYRMISAPTSLPDPLDTLLEQWFMRISNERLKAKIPAMTGGMHEESAVGPSTSSSLF